MYPVADLYAAIRDNDNETTGESDVTGKVIGYAGEVLTTAGTLALGLGVLAAEPCGSPLQRYYVRPVPPCAPSLTRSRSAKEAEPIDRTG
jgi:hypothetical protein